MRRGAHGPAIAAGVTNPGFNDPRQPERWVSGLKLVEEIFLTRAPEVAELPLIVRLTSRLAAPSATVSRLIGTTILRYRFSIVGETRACTAGTSRPRHEPPSYAQTQDAPTVSTTKPAQPRDGSLRVAASH